jgi:hypothetical protein
MRQVIHAVAYQIWTTSGNNLSVTSSFINWLDNIYHKQRNPFNQVSQLTKLTISFHLPQTRAWIINLPIKSYWKRRIKLSNILKNFENTLNTVFKAQRWWRLCMSLIIEEFPGSGNLTFWTAIYIYIWRGIWQFAQSWKRGYIAKVTCFLVVCIWQGLGIWI